MLAGFLMVAGGFWWLCTQNDGIAFLTTKPDAEWIVYPRPPDLAAHSAFTNRTIFRHTFRLDAPPAGATLAVRAFRSAVVVINGRTLTRLDLTGRNWKLSSTADVTGLLRAGTNEISVSVSNSVGPPALWLRLRTDRLSRGTDERWQASVVDDEWQQARRASQPPALRRDKMDFGGERVANSLKRTWFAPVIFCAIAIVVVGGVSRLRQRQTKPRVARITGSPTQRMYGLLIIVAVVRIVLSTNNLLQLPRPVGFDAEHHEEYIQFIQEKHALPWPENGWEMYQPPLYYAGNALLLEVCGLRVPGADATFVLRIANGVIGVFHCWLALLCLRLLFPKNLSAQAVGLLVAAFLPPHLYLSQYVTNEPLAGLFVTGAFYFCLRVLRAERASVWLYVGVGSALGVAMLTKFSSLLAIPVFFGALGLHLLLRKERATGAWLRSLGAVLLSCLVVCGWYYVRIWVHAGRPFVGNWSTDWWQQPGFQTSAYYFRFGQALVSPLFSGFHSFGDGIYSTLWGDGLISGKSSLMFRPPWNYNLMNVGYLLAVAISFLLLAGFIVALVRFIRKPAPEWFIVLGLPLIFFLGMIYMSFVVPSYSEVKAFYAFPALVPFSALVAVGWDWLARRHRVMRSALWVILLVWVMTVYTAFWIRGSNPETWRLRGILKMEQKDYVAADKSLSRALGLKPDDAVTHYYLAGTLMFLNRASEAVRQYQEALRLNPDFAMAHDYLAVVLASQSHLTEAIRHSREAVRLRPDDPRIRCDSGFIFSCANRPTEAIAQFQAALRLQPGFASARDLLGNEFIHLGQALYQRGQLNQAVMPLQEGLRIHPDNAGACNGLAYIFFRQGQAGEAATCFEKVLKLQPNNVDALKDLAWIRATCPETSLRNGGEAVKLAQQANQLSGRKDPSILAALAAAYAEVGQFRSAAAIARNALELETAQGNVKVVNALRKQIRCYEAGTPFRDNSLTSTRPAQSRP